MEKQTSGHSADRPGILPIPHALAQLSPQRIAAMSEEELRILLPQIVSMLQQGLSPEKPSWWPASSLPWTLHNLKAAVKRANPALVRALVNKCNTFLAQHAMRSTAAQTAVLAQPRVVDWLYNQAPKHMFPQTAQSAVFSRPKQQDVVPYVDTYLCCQCDTEFSTKDTLRKHQVQCCRMNMDVNMPSTPPVSEAPSPALCATALDDSSTSEPSSCTSPSGSSVVSQSQVISALDLVPIDKARKIRKAQRRNTECETLDLEDAVTPLSPSTPRTPKLLMSQLSRDNSTGVTGSGTGQSRRRLSYLRLSVEKRPDSQAGEEGDGEKDGDSDGESAESNAEDAEEAKRQKRSLFNIDVSSSLGQRVLKHMNTETHMSVISDAEEFCRTPIKDKYQGRLRIREPTYPVTWKLTQKRIKQQNDYHVFKFSRDHKVEFMEKMRTGLDFQSRQLLKSMKTCSVLIKRLSRKTFYKWSKSNRRKINLLGSLTASDILQPKRPKPVIIQPSIFPEGPTFSSIDCDRLLGLKRKDGSPEMAKKLLASHCVSETANVELQQQKMTVYRCLLTDLYYSQSWEEIQSPPEKCRRTGGEQKRVTAGHGVRHPTLLSMLDGTASGARCSLQNKKKDVCADINVPLKIDIPSSTSEVLPHAQDCIVNDRVSGLIEPTDQKDEDRAACCSTSAPCKKCQDSSKDVSGRAGHSGASSLAASSKSSSVHPSPNPPDLNPCSLTPQISVTTNCSLSPPKLSPVSPATKPSVPSAACTPRMATRSSGLSPSPQPASSPRKSPHRPPSVLTASNKSQSLLSNLSEKRTDTGSGSDRMGTREQHNSTSLLIPKSDHYGQVVHKHNTRSVSLHDAAGLGADRNNVSESTPSLPTFCPVSSKDTEADMPVSNLIEAKMPEPVVKSQVSPLTRFSSEILLKKASTVPSHMAAGSSVINATWKGRTRHTGDSPDSSSIVQSVTVKERNACKRPFKDIWREDDEMGQRGIRERRTVGKERKLEKTASSQESEGSDKTEDGINIEGNTKALNSGAEVASDIDMSVEGIARNGDINHYGKMLVDGKALVAGHSPMKKNGTELALAATKETAATKKNVGKRSQETREHSAVRNTRKRSMVQNESIQIKVSEAAQHDEVVVARNTRRVERKDSKESISQSVRGKNKEGNGVKAVRDRIERRAATARKLTARQKIMSVKNEVRPGSIRLQALARNGCMLRSGRMQAERTKIKSAKGKDLPNKLKHSSMTVPKRNINDHNTAPTTHIQAARGAQSEPFTNENKSKVLKSDGKRKEAGDATCGKSPVKSGATEVPGIGHAVSGTTTTRSGKISINPFLNRTQTRLFSKNIIKRNRRHWKQSRKVLSLSEDLKSGKVLGESNSSPNCAPANDRGLEASSLPNSACSTSTCSTSSEPMGSSAPFQSQGTCAESEKCAPSSRETPRIDIPLKRKGLSPKQMMSVLEFVKGNTCPKAKSPTGLKLENSDCTTTKKMEDSSLPGRSSGYHTRAKESPSPRKRALDC